MTVVLDKETRFSPSPAPDRLPPVPVIHREGIRWRGGAGGAPLAVELCFENPARVPSAPAEARVEVGAFGAFLPWRPLTAVAVPSIPPGGRVVVTAEAAGELPPAPPRAGGWRGRTRGFLDLLTLLHRRGLEAPHFVGNLNVFVARSRPVERHLQRAVGLQAGRPNLTMFCVGDGEPDSYAFRLDAEPGWEVEIAPVAWDEPVEAASLSVCAVLRPPAEARSGRVAIHVRRGSTGVEVPVEFELEARAPGPKCYTVG
jgi:hypothetical protein